MQMPRASTRTVRAVAALLTATSPIAAAFPAAAQQQMLSGPADVSKCGAIKDPIKSARCVDDYMAASIAESKARIAAANARVATADTEGDCGRKLLEAAKDPTRQARGHALLTAAGKDVAVYGACKLLRQLTP